MLIRMTPKMETVAKVGIMALPDFSMMYRSVGIRTAYKIRVSTKVLT